MALNPPRSESLLEPVDHSELGAAIGDDVIDVDRNGSWDGAVYRVRQGPELWWAFLFAMLLLLLGESVMATSGQVSPLGRLVAPEGKDGE